MDVCYVYDSAVRRFDEYIYTSNGFAKCVFYASSLAIWTERDPSAYLQFAEIAAENRIYASVVDCENSAQCIAGASC